MATKCPRAPVLLAISLLVTCCLALFASTVSKDSSKVEPPLHLRHLYTTQ